MRRPRGVTGSDVRHQVDALGARRDRRGARGKGRTCRRGQRREDCERVRALHAPLQHLDAPIVVLDEGRVVMHGSPSEVFASSALAGHEVAYPLFAEAGLALRADGASVPSIPVTKSQALEAFSALAATRTESAS